MANPVWKTITAGAVPTLVADAVTAGEVKVQKKYGTGGHPIKYMETYLVDGTAAPTDQSMMVAFDWQKENSLTLDASGASDFYIAVIGAEDGLVRVDL